MLASDCADAEIEDKPHLGKDALLSLAVTLTELGEAELARGRPLNARSLQLRALEIAGASGEDGRLAGVLGRLALVYLNLSELNNAERSATPAQAQIGGTAIRGESAFSPGGRSPLAASHRC